MALEDRTVAELDELAADAAVDGYPASGKKAEKVAALQAAGVDDGPDDGDAPEHQRQVNRGKVGLDPALAAVRDAQAEVEAGVRPVRQNERRVDVVGAEAFEAARAAAAKAEGIDLDVREGPAEA